MDTTNPAVSSVPLDVVVETASPDTVNLTTGAGNLGINSTTPTLIYGLGGSDTLNASGMTGPVWFVGGAGGDTMTGGSGANAYLYLASNESAPGVGLFDVSTNFDVATDIIDLRGIGGPALSFQAAQLSGSTVAKDTIAWKESGGNTFVYVNTSSNSEVVGGTDMMLQLNGNRALTTVDFLHN
jgi:hypothetical protein